jgi:hypothetical protein
VIGHLVGGTITEYVPPRPQRRRRIVAGVLAGVLLGSLLTYEVSFIGRFIQGQCAIGPLPLAVNGSSAFYPTAQAEAASYHASCPIAFFSVGSSSSGAGLRMLETGSVKIADSELSAREAGFSNADLVEHRVALIVHPDPRVTRSEREGPGHPPDAEPNPAAPGQLDLEDQRQEGTVGGSRPLPGGPREPPPLGVHQ